MVRNWVGIVGKICLKKKTMLKVEVLNLKLSIAMICTKFKKKRKAKPKQKEKRQMFKRKTFEQVYVCEMWYVGIILRQFVKGVNCYFQCLSVGIFENTVTVWCAFWEKYCESMMCILRKILWKYDVCFEKESNREFIQPREIDTWSLKIIVLFTLPSMPGSASRLIIEDHLRTNHAHQCALRANFRWPGNTLEGS